MMTLTGLHTCQQKQKIKIALCLLLAISILTGCSNNKYTKSYIKKNVDFSLNKKTVELELTTAEAVQNGYGGMGYETISIDGNNVSILFHVGNFSLKVAQLGDKCQAVSTIGNQQVLYNISGNINEIQTISKELAILNSMTNYKWSKVKVDSIKGNSETNETAVVISEKERDSILFLDNKDNLKRIETITYDKNHNPDCMYFLVVKDKFSLVMLPELVYDEEDTKTIDDISPQDFNTELTGFLFGGFTNYSETAPQE